MNYDYLIVGGGISGAAVGYELAQHGKVIIVEAETHAGYHSTGRSAALYTPHYGPDLVRSICQLGRAFLTQPPAGFAEHALLSPRGMMNVFPFGAEQAMTVQLEDGGEHLIELSAEQALHMAPFLRLDRVSGATYEEGVLDLDVSSLHQGFLRGFKQCGGTLQTNTRVESITKLSSGWEVAANNASLQARVIVNAAGAWADEIGAMANASLIGLQPKRRTAMLIDVPIGMDDRLIPATDFYGVENYIKPQGAQLMVSPGDETPVAPQDIQIDDMDIAVLVDWLERETTIDVSRVEHSWAGLRNFVADGMPVVGFDEQVEDFFWLAAQGGYGIMMAAPLAEASASLITKSRLPAEFVDAGIDKHQLSGQRLPIA